MADESSGISWESSEAALWRLHDEKGEDTMATKYGNSNRPRGIRWDCNWSRAHGSMHGIASSGNGMRYSDDASRTSMLRHNRHAGSGTNTVRSIFQHGIDTAEAVIRAPV